MFNAICDFQLRTRFNLSATRSLCFWSNCWSKLRLRNVVLGITGAAAICFGTKRERDRERLLALGRTGALCAGAPPPPPCFCIIVKRSFNDKTVDPFKWTLPIDDIFFPSFIRFFTLVFNYSFKQIPFALLFSYRLYFKFWCKLTLLFWFFSQLHLMIHYNNKMQRKTK